MALESDVEIGPGGAGLRCAEWTRSEGVAPIGTAGTYDTVLLVECPPPWPKDVSDIPALAAAAVRHPRTRVLAVVPRVEDDTGLVRVVCWHRAGSAGFTGIDHRVPTERVPALLDALIDDPVSEHDGFAGASPRDVLLCAHGKRDRCCGRAGTLLDAEVASRWPGVRTWRCSHTGGHRFAPTGLTFPDGRAWAYLDAGVLDGIIHRTTDWRRLEAHHRGSLGLDRWAQAAEGAVLHHLGWAWADRPDLATDTEVADDSRRATVSMSWPTEAGPHRAVAEVSVTRDVPVVACGLPLSEAAKTAAELRVTSLQLPTPP